MYSLHLTGNPWFLLLILPGLWILRRQYRGFSGAGAVPRGANLLWALQSLALIMLAFSLTAPELRRHKVEFHNPAVLILRDQSGSFRDGAYLGLGARYGEFENEIMRTYRGRKFDVRVIDFAETAWPVSGFPKQGRPQAGEAVPGDATPLTSLAALADFVDSAAVPNLQAAFLFSDGRSNLDSGRASRTWRIPLFPVVFSPDSIAEIEPEKVDLSFNPEAAGGAVDVGVAWRSVGRAGSEASLKFLQGKKTLLARKLPAATRSPQGAIGDNAESSHFSWTPDKAVLAGHEPIRAVIAPGDAVADFDPYNDTLDVSFPQGRVERNILIFRPLRSLDEKGMVDILQAWEGTRVSFFGLEDLGRMSLTAKDQVWVEAGALDARASAGGQSRLQAWLASSPAKAIVYSRWDGGRNPQVAGADAPWRPFTPAAEIKAGKPAAEAFPDEVVRLKSLTGEPISAPDAPGSAWVEVMESGKRGMLMGRMPLGKDKRAFFFGLPAIWGTLFDPQGDFATRENIAEYIKAAQRLGDMEDGAIHVSRPARAYEGVPFDIEVRLPEGLRGGKAGASPPVLSIAGGAGFSKEWPEASVKNITLSRGTYRLELKAGAQVLWKDSLTVAPKAALELARIGFDRGSLEDAASRSGGQVLDPRSRDSARVTYRLPDLPDAQVRTEKTTAIRLYNTLAQCLFVLLLLSLSWLLRKKWDFD